MASGSYMNEIEIIDKMLAFDVEKNPTGKGFISPSVLFDSIGIPENIRSELLRGVLELNLFEYNSPKTGIRASHVGRRVYRTGGYKKTKRNEKIADWFDKTIKILSIK